MPKYFTSKNQGILINIKLSPKSKKTGFLGFIGDSIKIGVSSPPVDNKANKELITFLSKEFKVSKQAITLESGLASRTKKVLITGVERLPEKWEVP